MISLRAIFLKLCAVTLFLVMASLIKASSETVPPGQAVFFRSFFAFPILIGWLAWRGDLRTGFKARRPSAHIIRGLVGTGAMATSFAGLGLLPLPEVTAIRFASPLFVVVFAAVLLGETVRLFRSTAVLVGFAGVIIVMYPRLSGGAAFAMEGAALGAILCLIGAALAALAHVQIRNMTKTEKTSAIVFWFTITSMTLSLLTIPFGWAMPSWQVATMLICAGLCGGAGQIFMTTAYSKADVSLLAPFDYASIVMAMVVGYFVFAEVPTGNMIVGAIIVTSAGGAIIWRERQLAMRPPSPAP
ncbi:DMT family transporter [Tropicimonas sp. S265A]|uniref:DMT family transporter n=1 Tax=Tropicimonas sp. S265A TaxID=3415134 RepID=UPI003C7D6D22